MVRIKLVRVFVQEKTQQEVEEVYVALLHYWQAWGVKFSYDEELAIVNCAFMLASNGFIVKIT